MFSKTETFKRRLTFVIISSLLDFFVFRLSPIYNIYIYHHHHIVLAARISLTLSRHSSLSFIALGRSSGQQPVSSHSCWMYVRAGRPAFARPCVGIHKSTSLMSSSLTIYSDVYVYDLLFAFPIALISLRMLCIQLFSPTSMEKW